MSNAQVTKFEEEETSVGTMKVETVEQENSDREIPVDVYMKVIDRNSRKVLFDSVSNFPSTYGVVKSFLKEHSNDISDYSGYAGDISSDLSGEKVGFASPRPRYTMGSVISTIPGENPPRSIPSTRESRLSNASTISGKRPNRNSDPLLTSTKVGDISHGKAAIVTDSKSSSETSLSNGELLPPPGITLSTTNDSTSEMEIDTKIKEDVNGNTPRARKRRKNSKNSESSEDKSITNVVTNQAKRLKKASDVFDTSSNEGSTATSTTSTANESSSVADRQIEDPIVKTETAKAQFLESPACGSRVLEEHEALKLAKSQTLWGTVAIGEWVFARWRDKNYYSGQITQKGENDTWRIHFEDNMDDVASETHILPIKIIGKDVKAVYSPDNIYKPYLATVVGQLFLDNDKAEYVIKCQDLTMNLVCQRKQLSIKESEAKELRKQLALAAPKAADLSLDNIVAGPRRRIVGATPGTTPVQSGKRKVVGGAFDASSADDSVLKDSGAATPVIPKKPGPKPSKGSSSSSGNEKSRSFVTNSDDSTPIRNIIAVANKVAVANKPTKEIKEEVRKDAKEKETPKAPPKETAKKGGRVRDVEKLFEGMQFFLTASGGGDPASSGSVAPQAQLAPYDKDEYKESIESRGGKVVDSVGRERGKESVFLISDSHARTVKYIYCLAAGIPCVSHSWILKCLDTISIVDWKEFELKSGYSLEQEEVIPAHQKKPLKNFKIFVTAETDELYNYWKPVLTAAEAILLKPKKKGSGSVVPPETQVVVTDSSCSQEVFDKVLANDIPIVKPEWLVQSIITGKMASYTGHERYKISPGGEFEEDE